MVPEDMEFLFEYEGYDFYALEEEGLTHKKLAKQYHLYEQFPKGSPSTYYAILCKNLYNTNFISQVWVFKDDIPVGLALGVHHDRTIESNGFKGNILGHIQLYTDPAHRGKGIASEMVCALESMMVKPTPYLPCVIMQDDAYRFHTQLQKAWCLPYGEFSSNYHDNKIHFEEHCNNLSQEMHEYLKKAHPGFYSAPAKKLKVA